MLGAILARGRRTVTSWIRAAGLSQEFRPCSTTVSAAGKRTDGVAARLVHGVVKPLLAGVSRLVFGIDDTPTPCRGVPGKRPAGKRGPNRTYGPSRIELAKRAGQKRGWRSGTFELSGKAVVKS